MADNEPPDPTPVEEDPRPSTPEDQPPADEKTDEGPPSAPTDPAPDRSKDPGPEGLNDETDVPSTGWVRDGDQRRRLVEDGLRDLGVDPDLFAQMYQSGLIGGRGSDGKTAFGQMSMAANKIVNRITAASESDRVHGGEPLRASWISSTLATYVKCEQFEEILATLRDHNVAYVTGADGDGRTTTAYAALRKIVGDGKIIPIDLDQGVDFTMILNHPKVLRPAHGHVVELDRTQSVQRQQTLSTLSGRLVKLKAYVVIIAPPAARTDSVLRPYEILHKRSDATNILRKHLTNLLNNGTDEIIEDAASYVDVCLADPAIVEHLRKAPPPGEVVALAKRLIEIKKGKKQPADAVKLLPTALRELAVETLRREDSEDDDHALRRFSVRVVYALWNGSSYSVIYELATNLFTALSTAGDSKKSGTVLAHGMSHLIDPKMRGHENDEELDAQPRGDRRVQLVDPELARAVLGAVWHIYHQLREPLLRWLHDVGGDPREHVRMKAGHVAGQLAIYDYGYVYRQLLRRWATSRLVAHRQAASWALERIALDTKWTDRARRQVRDWAYSPDPFMSDTAARTYATSLGSIADDALLNLRLIATRLEHVKNHSVALAVAQLYQPSQTDLGITILEDLNDWMIDDRRSPLQVHAARAVTYLAQRTAPQPDEDWPALLRLVDSNDQSRKHLIALWRTALTETATTHRAWAVVHAWLTRADDRGGELDEATICFAAELIHEFPVRRRALFYLRLWREETPDTTIFQRLHDRLTQGES